MALNLFNQAMSKVGGKEYVLNDISPPSCVAKAMDDIEDAISLDAFIRDACRDTKRVKTVAVLFDVHKGVPEFGNMSALGDSVKADTPHTLPAALRPGDHLPAGAKMSFIARNLEDGMCDVLTIFYFREPTPTKEMIKLCTG